MRRWLIRLMVVLLVLLVVLAGGVQAVLWSDLPRSVAADQLAKQTGLVVELDGLSTGWAGQTRVEGLTLRLPLSDKPAVRLREATLHHTALPTLAATQSFTLARVEAEGLSLNLRRLEDGRWNAAKLVQTIAANQPASNEPAQTPPPLPVVDARDVTVTVQRDGKRIALPTAVVRLSEQAEGSGRLNVNARAAGIGQVTGVVARRAPYTHRLALTLRPGGDWPGELLGPDAAGAITRLGGTVHWQGAAQAKGLAGRVRFDPLSYGQARVTGGVDLELAGGDLTARPAGLTLRHPRLPGPEPVALTGGRAGFADGRVTLTGVTADTLGGTVRLGGDFDTGDLTGELALDWAGLEYPAEMVHAGRFALDISRRRPGRRSVGGTMTVTGRKSPVGPWETRLSLDLSGRSWTSLAGQLSLDRLRIDRPNQDAGPIAMRGLDAEVAVSPEQIALNEVSMTGPGAPAELSSEGRFSWASQQWGFDFSARELNVTGLPAIERVVLGIEGEGPAMKLTAGELIAAGLEVTAEGAYKPSRPDAGDPPPLTGTLTLNQLPLKLREATRSLVRATNLRGEISVKGALDPLWLEGNGTLRAIGLQAGEETLGDIRLDVEATATPEAVTLSTQQLSILEGTWRIEGRYNLGQTSRKRYHVTVKGRSLDLARLSRAMGTGPWIKGRGHLTLEADGSALTLRQLNVRGEFAGDRLGLGPVSVDQLEGKVQIQDGQLRLQELTARHDRQGKLTGSAQLMLDEPARVGFDLAIEPWSLLPGQAAALTVGGQLEGEFDAAERTGTASGKLTTRLASEQAELVSLATPIELEGSAVTLESIRGSVLDGEARGSSVIQLQDWLDSRFSLRWDGGRPSELAGLAPAMRRVEGPVGGSLTLGPSSREHPLGPFQASLELEPAERARYGAIGIGPTTVKAYYVNPDKVVLERLDTRLAGGRVNLWGRLSRHDQRWQVFASVTRFEDQLGQASNAIARQNPGSPVANVQLAPILQTFQPTQEPVVGLIDVPEANLTTELAFDREPKQMASHLIRHLHGRGRVKVSQSDFAAVPIFTELYDLMNLSLGQTEPKGEGQTAFRFEGGRLVFENLRYDNRGMRVRILGLEMRDLMKGGQSPIKGYAIASLNPLPDIDALEMINEAISTLQAGVTSVQMSGTLGKPKVQLTAIANLTDSLSALLGGDSPDEQSDAATQSEPNSNAPATQ